MKFEKLFDTFNDEDHCIRDVLSKIANSVDQGKSQKLLDDHIERLQKNDSKLMLRVDEALATLLVAHMDVSFVAGFVLGQAFDVVDTKALKEIHSMKAKLEAKGVIRYWPRDKKAPDHPRKEDTGASK